MSFKSGLLLFLATVVDVASEMSYGNVYRDMRSFNWPGQKRQSMRQTVWRMIDQGYLDNNEGRLQMTQKARGYLAGMLPVRNFAQHKWDGKWRLVVFDIPETMRYRRNKLRTTLVAYGYGMWQKSIYITPHPVTEAINEFLKENDMGDQVVCLETFQVGGIDNIDLAEEVFGLWEWKDELELMVDEGRRILDEENKSEDEKIKWVRKWQEIVLADPHLPSQLDELNLGELRSEVGKIMAKMVSS